MRHDRTDDTRQDTERKSMQDKTAIVTGAAGGIGGAVVAALARAGARVAAVDREADRLSKCADECAGQPGTVEAFPADVTDAGAVRDLVDSVERTLGPLDFLVNAAGVLHLGPVVGFGDEEWARTLAVNTTGVFHMSRAVAERMMSRRSGAIVTVASNAARTPRAQMAAYSASKAAAAHFTKSLGVELAPYGIRCNVVGPGSTDTPMLSSMWQNESDREATVLGRPETFRLGIPLGRIARPENISDAVLFLLSDAAAHITLHDLTVDGGATLGA